MMKRVLLGEVLVLDRLSGKVLAAPGMGTVYTMNQNQMVLVPKCILVYSESALVLGDTRR